MIEFVVGVLLAARLHHQLNRGLTNVQIDALAQVRHLDDVRARIRHALQQPGKRTGKSSSGTGTIPHVSQWITGIGVPQ